MFIGRIKTNQRTYNLYSDNIENDKIEIYGFYFENNKFYPLNEDVFDEVKKLKIGKNNKYIGKTINNDIFYDVFLDIDTNLKHYFSDGKEDYKMFINNFEQRVVANLENNYAKQILSNKNASSINFGELFLATLTGLEFILVPTIFRDVSIVLELSSRSSIIAEKLNETPEITSEIIKDIIAYNENISQKDKNILLNENFIEFIIPYSKNNKEWSCELQTFILPNLNIKEKELDEKVIGTWNYCRNTIYIDVDKIKNDYPQDMYNDVYCDVLLHEFAHVFQPAENEYCFINEAVAEMTCNEFSPLIEDPSNSYFKEQKYIKILMETIGAEPILKYSYTGDIESIKKELEGYLNNNEINEFIECMKMHPDKKDVTKEILRNNYLKVEEIIRKLYKNKYNRDIEKNILANKFLNDTFLKNATYFNKNNEENVVIFYSETPSNREVTNYSYESYNIFKLKGLNYQNQSINDSGKIKVKLNKQKNLELYDINVINKVFAENNNLTYEQKRFLYNSELFNDYASIATPINVVMNYSTEYRDGKTISLLDNFDYELFTKQYVLEKNLKELKIEDSNLDVLSYINLKDSTININTDNCKKYAEKNNLSYKHVYSYELVKQFMNNFINQNDAECSNIINDACTSIFIKEYYGIDSIDKPIYTEIKERTVKILMDLIGSEPIKDYCFNGKKEVIIRALKPYLSNEYISKFSDIIFSTEITNDRLLKIVDEINSYLQIMYNETNNVKINIQDYYIPETKGYFSEKYIENDKLKHPENYNQSVLNNRTK